MNLPKAIVVSCVEPLGYPDQWYHGIWREGIWKHKENVTQCIDPNRYLRMFVLFVYVFIIIHCLGVIQHLQLCHRITV